jgi:hypothetical protein
VVPNTGSFDVDISDLRPGAYPITVTVNYSADPPGTRRGRTHTSNFSTPVFGTRTVVTQGELANLAATFSTNDLIAGLIPAVLPGDKGWHPANTDPADQLPAFTDGEGVRASGLTGLLNDFPGTATPAKLIRYALALPADVNEVRVFTGNNGRDGRVFHTYTVRFSSDHGVTFSDPIYVQSHPSGTLNNNLNNQWRAVLSQLTGKAGPLALKATHVEFAFYAVDNTGGQMRDPYEGVNPYTGWDDLLTAAFVSPLVWEIDVLGIENSPLLTATRTGGSIQLSWQAKATTFAIQGASQLAPAANFADLQPQPAVQRNGLTNTATIPIGAAPQYLRLRAVQ